MFPTTGAMRAPHAESPSIAQTNADPDPHWWKQFNDPMLDSLIERAVAGNLDLQAAVLRIVEAHEQSVSAAAGLPQIGANASVQREQLG